MKHLYYVRHGQSVMNANDQWGGRSDTPLSELGIQQAKQTAKEAAAKGLQFDIIISSPLSRAHHTAQHIAKATGYPIQDIITHPHFVERSFGELEGTNNLEAKELYLIDEALVEKFKDVETMESMHKRADEAIAYLQSLPNDTVLVVAHGAFGRALLRRLQGLTSTERFVVIKNAELVKFI